mgnify:CR=1 FL=1
MARVILHIDLNAFFASCEEIKNPDLKEFPVAVGSTSKRGVISTANYEARKYGVHSAMPVYEALRLCPDLVLIQGDYGYYRSMSAQFFAYLKTFTHQIEPASIDECYMDVTDIIKRYKRPLDLVFEIQNGVYEKCHLNCSIGVAPNRFLAKMASDMRKPKGITVLRKSELSTKLWPLKINEMHGIGKKSVPVLNEMGIYTIGDFADEKNEQKMIQKARGNSSAALCYSTTQKSISISRTYSNDLYSIDEVSSNLQIIINELTHKMQRENQKGRLVTLTLRDTAFHNVCHSMNLSTYSNTYPMIYGACMQLLEAYFEPIGYRYIGVHVGSLKDAKQIVEQVDLFEVPQENTDFILNRLNAKMDSKCFIKASDLLKKEGSN